MTEFLGREVPALCRAKGCADIGPQTGGFGEAQPHIGDSHLPARATCGGALESRKLLDRKPGHERGPLSQVTRNSFGRNPSITAPSERTMTGDPAMPFSRAKRSLASSGEVSQKAPPGASRICRDAIVAGYSKKSATLPGPDR